MLLAIVLAAAYFGLDFDSATTNVATESRIYPVNPVAYRMVQPDGKVRIFELTDAKEGILLGGKPWLGVVKDDRIDIWADPKYTGGKLRTAFTFVAGRLRLMVLDGEKFTFPPMRRPKADIADMFPERKARSFEKNSSADIWQNDRKRLRLWFANPNSAGMLLAEVLLALVWMATRQDCLQSEQRMQEAFSRNAARLCFCPVWRFLPPGLPSSAIRVASSILSVRSTPAT